MGCCSRKQLHVRTLEVFGYTGMIRLRLAWWVQALCLGEEVESILDPEAKIGLEEDCE